MAICRGILKRADAADLGLVTSYGRYLYQCPECHRYVVAVTSKPETSSCEDDSEATVRVLDIKFPLRATLIAEILHNINEPYIKRFERSFSGKFLDVNWYTTERGRRFLIAIVEAVRLRSGGKRYEQRILDLIKRFRAMPEVYTEFDAAITLGAPDDVARRILHGLFVGRVRARKR